MKRIVVVVVVGGGIGGDFRWGASDWLIRVSKQPVAAVGLFVRYSFDECWQG